MGCCLLAAIVIGRWLALWDGLRQGLARARARLLRRPRPKPPEPAAPRAAWRPRLGAKAAAFVAAEVLALSLLAVHEFGIGPHAGHGLAGRAALEPVVARTPLCSAPKDVSVAGAGRSRAPVDRSVTPTLRGPAEATAIRTRPLF